MADHRMQAKQAREVIFFLYSVWRIRQDYLRTLGKPARSRDIIERIEEKQDDLLKGAQKKKTISAQLQSFLESPPSEAILYFTDGSAIPNPGPSGAGVFRQAGSLPEVSISVHLGFGSNNEAELYAIGVALKCILRVGGAGYNVIFTDSEYAHGILERKHKIKSHERLANMVLELLREARELNVVHIVWIKAHAGFEGNERADGLAGQGASPECRLQDLDKDRFLTDPD